MMNDFIVTTKTTTQFFSEKAYIENDMRVDSEFIVERFVLSRSLAMFNQFTVERVTNSFSNLIYYNDPLMEMLGSGTDTFTTYNAKPDLAKVYPYSDIHKSIETYVQSSAPIYAPLSVKFS